MVVTNPYVIPLSWRNLVLVLSGGVALWVLPWLAWSSVRALPAHEEVRKRPVYRYIRGARTVEGSTWSPVLMPFPTSVGFSRKAALAEMPSKSPVSVLKPKVLMPLYLDLKNPPLPVLSGPAMESLANASFDPESAAPPVLQLEPGGSRGGLQVEVTPELRSRRFTAPALEKLSGAETATPGYSATAYVELDRRGFVQHLLLEQPGGVAAVDAAVVRSLRAGAGVAGAGPAAGRVRVFCWTAARSEKE